MVKATKKFPREWTVSVVALREGLSKAFEAGYKAKEDELIDKRVDTISIVD